MSESRHRVSISFLQNFLRQNLIVRLFIFGYLSQIILGWLILQFPVCHSSVVFKMDHFFMSVSAVSTTGLATVDIGTAYTFNGQLVLLLLMQLGGISYLLFSSFVILNLKQRVVDLRKKDLSSDFNFRSLILHCLGYTILFETLGSLILYFIFQNENLENPCWQAIFHSVSAFCTTGFSLFSTNLENYQTHLGINVTLSFLSIFGAFGFFLWMNFIKSLIGKEERIRWIERITRSLAMILILIGTAVFLLTVSFAKDNVLFQKFLVSFFHSVSSVTTVGFNTIRMQVFPVGTLIFLMILMLLGASLTVGAIHLKNTSFETFLQLIRNALRPPTHLRSQKVFLKKMQLASSICIQYLIVLAIPLFLLLLIEKHSLVSLIFEAISAACTVGLSFGITQDLSFFGKSLISLLMLVGRTGILIFGFALASQELTIKEKELLPPINLSQ